MRVEKREDGQTSFDFSDLQAELCRGLKEEGKVEALAKALKEAPDDSRDLIRRFISEIYAPVCRETDRYLESVRSEISAMTSEEDKLDAVAEILGATVSGATVSVGGIFWDSVYGEEEPADPRSPKHANTPEKRRELAGIIMGYSRCLSIDEYNPDDDIQVSRMEGGVRGQGLNGLAKVIEQHIDYCTFLLDPNDLPEYWYVLMIQIKNHARAESRTMNEKAVLYFKDAVQMLVEQMEEQKKKEGFQGLPRPEPALRRPAPASAPASAPELTPEPAEAALRRPASAPALSSASAPELTPEAALRRPAPAPGPALRRPAPMKVPSGGRLVALVSVSLVAVGTAVFFLPHLLAGAALLAVSILVTTAVGIGLGFGLYRLLQGLFNNKTAGCQLRNFDSPNKGNQTPRKDGALYDAKSDVSTTPGEGSPENSRSPSPLLFAATFELPSSEVAAAASPPGMEEGKVTQGSLGV